MNIVQFVLTASTIMAFSTGVFASTEQCAAQRQNISGAKTRIKMMITELGQVLATGELENFDSLRTGDNLAGVDYDKTAEGMIDRVEYHLFDIKETRESIRRLQHELPGLCK